MMRSGIKFDRDKYLSKLDEKELVIFLFHGVVEDSVYEVRNYNGKHLLSQNFIDLMDGLSRHDPLSMDEIIGLNDDKNGYPLNFYAITFDDGFKNNHDIAAPALDDFSTPATFLSHDSLYRIQPDVLDRIKLNIALNQFGPLPYFCLGQMKAHRFTTPKRKSLAQRKSEGMLRLIPANTWTMHSLEIFSTNAK